MPQKKNPDAAELLRAKAPRITSGFLTLAGVMHGLPLAYSKDLQEDKEALFDAVDNLELCLEAAEALQEALRFDRERLAEAAADEFAAATDIADLLVRKGCRSARPTASWAGSCARRSSGARRCPS